TSVLPRSAASASGNRPSSSGSLTRVPDAISSLTLDTSPRDAAQTSASRGSTFSSMVPPPRTRRRSPRCGAASGSATASVVGDDLDGQAGRARGEEERGGEGEVHLVAVDPAVDEDVYPEAARTAFLDPVAPRG